MRSVIEIAREAGLGFFRTRDSDNTSVDALERFAALIAIQMRDAAVKVCMDINAEYDGDTVSASWIASAIAALPIIGEQK